MRENAVRRVFSPFVFASIELEISFAKTGKKAEGRG